MMYYTGCHKLISQSEIPCMKIMRLSYILYRMSKYEFKNDFYCFLRYSVEISHTVIMLRRHRPICWHKPFLSNSSTKKVIVLIVRSRWQIDVTRNLVWCKAFHVLCDVWLHTIETTGRSSSNRLQLRIAYTIMHFCACIWEKMSFIAQYESFCKKSAPISIFQFTNEPNSLRFNHKNTNFTKR